MYYFLKSTLVRNISEKHVFFKLLLFFPKYTTAAKKQFQKWEDLGIHVHNTDSQRILATHFYSLKTVSAQLPS